VTAVRLGPRRSPAAAPAGAPAAAKIRRPKPARLLSRGSRMTMWACLLLGLALCALFGIVPMIANVIMSFTNYTALPGAAVNNVGFSNYTSMFTTEAPGFDQALIATLVFVVAVTVGQNVVGLVFAHRLHGESGPRQSGASWCSCRSRSASRSSA
jgi:ABC-type sugar transport system permease subunit